MTFSLPRGKRRKARWIVPAVLLAAASAVAVATLVWIAGSGSSPAGPAFAAAPQDLYVLNARDTGTEDVLVATSVETPADEREIVRLAHPPGLPSLGTTAPGSAMLAVAIPDGADAEAALAALKLVDLRTGTITHLLDGVDASQPPIWAADGRSIFTTRANGEGPLVDVTILRATTDGNVTEAALAPRVLGAYPVGTDSSGALLYVVIDKRGSTLVRDGHDVMLLSANITRDWALSPDAKQLAFIEAALDGGLHYLARVASIPGPGEAAASALEASGAGGRQALGAAWAPGQFAPSFGLEPAGAARSGVSAQAKAAGFDVPLSYAPGNVALAVQAWTGASFKEPGAMTVDVLSNAGRLSLPKGSRFFGWLSQ